MRIGLRPSLRPRIDRLHSGGAERRVVSGRKAEPVRRQPRPGGPSGCRRGPAALGHRRMPRNIFVLTGAGVSAESGLGTFRDKRGEGLWARFDPMKLATPEAFASNPEDVLAFYDARRRNLVNAKPNAAHRALARLERALAERGGHLTLVTQNIDDLHERAGSMHVIHMHGELFKVRCIACERVSPWRQDLGRLDRCPACGQTNGLRPHVVWFGEMPLHMNAIY